MTKPMAVTKSDLFSLIYEMERERNIASPKLRRLEEQYKEADDAESLFLDTCKEYKALQKKSKQLYQKCDQLRKKERAEFNSDMMKAKAIIRTEGPSNNAIKTVKAMAKKYGVL